jgi:hypothetical protein
MITLINAAMFVCGPDKFVDTVLPATQADEYIPKERLVELLFAGQPVDEDQIMCAHLSPFAAKTCVHVVALILTRRQYIRSGFLSTLACSFGTCE